MKWTREEYLDLLTGTNPKRQMFVELFGPLIGLEEEWLAQGASSEEVEMTAFDFDYVPQFSVGETGPIHTLEPVVLEENADYYIGRDYLGRTVKMCKATATIPLPLDYPVKNMEDWLQIKHMFTFYPERINWNQIEQAKKKMCKATATIPLPLDYPVKNMEDWLQIKHMFTFYPERINWNQIEQAKKLQKEGTLILAHIPGGFDLPRELMGEEVVCLSYYDQPELMQDILQTLSHIPGGFDLPRELMGEEVVCLSYYDQPELMQDILQTLSDTSYQVLDAISREITIDNLCVHEDMAGKSGPLAGPNQVQKFIAPYYRRIWDLLSSRGTKLFSQDSDGNMEAVIEPFMKAGVNLFYPCEPAAGMDIVSLRKKYGSKILFKGGIDKHVLRSSKEDIRRELEYKMQPLMQQGGVVFGLDHRIPNGTPLENYRYYVNTAREILGREPLSPEQKSWARMAF